MHIVDVDGTLLRSVGEVANKLHRRAFSRSMHKMFGIDTTIDVVKHHGSTDPLILLAVLEHHGISKDKVPNWSLQRGIMFRLLALHPECAMHNAPSLPYPTHTIVSVHFYYLGSKSIGGAPTINDRLL